MSNRRIVSVKEYAGRYIKKGQINESIFEQSVGRLPEYDMANKTWQILIDCIVATHLALLKSQSKCPDLFDDDNPEREPGLDYDIRTAIDDVMELHNCTRAEKPGGETVHIWNGCYEKCKAYFRAGRQYLLGRQRYLSNDKLNENIRKAVNTAIDFNSKFKHFDYADQYRDQLFQMALFELPMKKLAMGDIPVFDAAVERAIKKLKPNKNDTNMYVLTNPDGSEAE